MGRAKQQQLNAVAALRRNRQVPQRQPPKYAGTTHRVTHKGVPVQLDLYDEIDDSSIEGWKVMLVEAHTDQGPAGYLKISFIPQENMTKYYPDALNWAVRKGNHYAYLEPLLDKPEADWNRDDLLTALKATDGWLGYGRESVLAQRADANDKELRKLWRYQRHQCSLRHEKGYREFRQFFLNRPVVDFIRVYIASEPGVYRNGDRDRDETGPPQSSRLQGIGMTMYETAALWLEQQGLKLHASSLQTDEAQAVWSVFDKQEVVSSVGRGKAARRVLDPEKLREHKQVADLVISDTKD